MKYLFIFFYFVLFVSALDNQSILLQIRSSKDSYCNNEAVLKGVELNLKDVPQFYAMCNIPPPDQNQLAMLLDINVIPILCMGLYDVFQRLCKSVIRDHIFFKEASLSADQINNVFSIINSEDDYTSLDKFCQNTVEQNIVIEPASKDSDFWWKELNRQLNTSSNCKRICRTNEENRVQPLCSYITWANRQFLKFEHGDLSEAARIGGKKEILLQENATALANTKAFESNQIVVSWSQNQLNYTPTTSTVDSSHSTFHVKEPSKETNTTHTNKKDKIAFKDNSQAILNELPVQSSNEFQDEDKIVQGKTVQASTNKADPPSNNTNNKKNDNPKINLSNSKINSKAAPLQNVENSKVVDRVASTKSIKISKPEPDDNKNTFVPGNVDVLTQTDLDGNNKNIVTAEKPSQNTDDLGFALDVTSYGTEIEQPNLAGEEEDIGGGDENGEPELEGSIKTVSKEKESSLDKIEPSKPKPNSFNFDQGDSNKPYGEVQEVIIKDSFIETEDSNFFTYFLCMAVLTIMAYLVFHNKKKLLALAVEGRRSKSARRRPNSSNYSKLDCSLEEAMASNTTASVTHVLY